MKPSAVAIVGAGVAGLTCALELAQRGLAVQVFERAERLSANPCSWYAGGMLAPWCELESSEPLVARLGEQSIHWWCRQFPPTVRNGTLVVAHTRDLRELNHFAQRTQRFEWLDDAAIAQLEPDLAGRFTRALFFRQEAHLDPRRALQSLVDALQQLGASVHFGQAAPQHLWTEQPVIDCTGLAARERLQGLRGVKGEMLLVRLPEVTLSRPVRVLHPRVPVYVVPRGDGVFMIGATSIESDQPTRISARSLLELLSAAYALHPAFGEAEILEIGTGVRPSFDDNLPRIQRRQNVLHVNGLYRHGFLLAPALAGMVAEHLLQQRVFAEVMHEDSPERRLA